MAARIHLSPGAHRVSKCELLQVPTPFPLPNSRVLLLEPPGTCEIGLGKQLLEGTYNKPFIVDCGALRYLHFDLDKVRKSHALR